MADITWGIIGCGDVTEVKSGPAFSRVRGSRLVAVMRRDAAKARDYARRHQVARWYDHVDDLLDDPEVNAVYVATPTISHCELTLRALASGRPVLVEKPMALTADEADRMIAAAERHGLPLFVAYYRRALPRFEALRERIRSGAIGDVRAVTARHIRPGKYAPRHAWKIDPQINGGGLFVDAQVHTLDWLDHCFGPPSAVQGLVRRLGPGCAEDLVAYTLGWDEGQVASGIYCFGAGPEEEVVTIYGTEGSAAMKFFGGPGFTIRRIDGPEETVTMPDPPHVHEPLIARIVEELQGGRRAPSRAVDGIRTTQLVDRLYADHRAGRWPSAPPDRQFWRDAG